MTMRRQRLAMFAAAAAVLVAAALASAQRRIDLPAETAAYRASDLPGYGLVQQHCLLCHSAEYVATQPPTSPRAYWEATVRKMQRPFGAPIPDGDVLPIVEYLVRTYGAEP